MGDQILTLHNAHMNHRPVCRFVVTLIGFVASPVIFAQAETPIPRSVSGDKGKYYLIDSKRTGDVVTAIHRRVGVDSLSFTKTEINCKTKKLRELGYGEDSLKNLKGPATKWADLVPGSSKSDLAAFVCK